MRPEPNSQVVHACPPSHRRLRRVLSAIVLMLVVMLAATLAYLALTGGINS